MSGPWSGGQAGGVRNVKHLANPRKVRHLETICLRLGLVPPRILTPDMLWEDEDEEEAEP